jgi:hypothetical protein
MPKKDGDKIQIPATYAQTKNLHPYGQQVQRAQNQAQGKLNPKAQMAVGMGFGLLCKLDKPQ